MASKLFMLEDDEDIARLIGAAVEREGLEFLAAGATQGAAQAMRRFKPDIALLDVELPDGDGYGVCAQIRADETLKAVPIIFLTRKADVDSRLRGFAAGGQDYIQKPFWVEEVLARVRAHLDLKRHSDALKRDNEAMVIRERVHRDMVDMIVHDLRSPLSSIEVTLGLLSESGIIAKGVYAGLLANAKESAEMALLMTGDILDVSAGGLKVEPEPFDAPVLWKRIQVLFAPTLASGRIRLEADIPPGMREVRTDPKLIFRIIANLISNAVKFSASGGLVLVKMRDLPAGLRVEVSDQGPGVTNSEKEEIFLKYYRGKGPGTRIMPGNGIGLAFCKMACEALGGRIWVEDVLPKGSRFVAELPSLGEGPSVGMVPPRQAQPSKLN